MLHSKLLDLCFLDKRWPRWLNAAPTQGSYGRHVALWGHHGVTKGRAGSGSTPLRGTRWEVYWWLVPGSAQKHEKPTDWSRNLAKICDVAAKSPDRDVRKGVANYFRFWEISRWVNQRSVPGRLLEDCFVAQRAICSNLNPLQYRPGIHIWNGGSEPYQQ